MKPENLDLVACLKVLADPARLRLLRLCAVAECAVSELTKVMGISQPRVSQHLKGLCDAGLLERFRDGQFVYYRATRDGQAARLRRRLMELLGDEPVFDADLSKLRKLRADDQVGEEVASGDEDRLLYRYLLDLTIAAPLGELLDIGCGRGDVLKLLASRSAKAIGVDIDPSARRLARAELLTAGVPNCSLRQGDMYALPFDDASFDTVIIDDTLTNAERPTEALVEAQRVARPQGRVVLLLRTGPDEFKADASQLADWCSTAGLRLSAPRPIPVKNAQWLFAVATSVRPTEAAA